MITKVVEKRRTCAWYEGFSDFYDGILQVAKMQEFFKEHSAGFHLVQAREIWKNYTEDYYQMDRYYRQFHLCFQRSLETSNLLLDDLFKHVVDQVEGLYSHWFLGELGNNWSDVCAEELAEYGKVMEIPHQEDFYRSRVKNADSRVFVIISDAMRYEVAATLAEELQRENQSQVKLQNMQSIFPSITKFGMAALLPHSELSVEVKNELLCVLADGQSTASTNRDKVMKAANPASVALQYKNIIGMKRADRSALVKGMDVVYIYHDTIDEASHTSDTAVFSACEKAISELKNMVRIIVNEFGADTLRTYEMFIGAFDLSASWSQEGVRGCRRFLDRVWKLQDLVTGEEGYSKELETKMHQTIKKVSTDYESLKYNTGIAAMMALINDMYKAGKVTGDEFKTLLILLNPVAPHMTEELWEIMGYGGRLYQTQWPKWEEAKTVEAQIEIAVQVNGKVRATVKLPADVSKEDAIAAGKEAVVDKLSGNIVKEIYVPGRLVNLVCK